MLNEKLELDRGEKNSWTKCWEKEKKLDGMEGERVKSNISSVFKCMQHVQSSHYLSTTLSHIL